MKPYRLTVDNDLRIKTWSKGLESARGKSSSAVRGMAYHEILPKLDHNGTDAVIQVIREGKPVTISAYHVNCFYGIVKGNVIIRPLRNRHGNVTGAQIEFGLQPECTMHQKLCECQPFIDIGKIASSLAHGVRNPLNAIKGAVVYLREKYAHEETLLEFTTMMEEEISRLDRFISSFLSSSLSELGLTRTDLNALLKKIEVFISLQAHAKGIRTVFEYGDILPLVVDPFHIEQAVLNVINNALDAMARGGELTVASSLELCAGAESVVIEVSDTGPGLSRAMIEREGVSGKENGHGFGLFITREVMRFYGGHVEIRSRRGVSTTVRLCLPVAQQKEKA
jgi:two-component system, NtrC family, nitrogen regulation sensor histidine kinase GlnL